MTLKRLNNIIIIRKINNKNSSNNTYNSSDDCPDIKIILCDTHQLFDTGKFNVETKGYLINDL